VNAPGKETKSSIRWQEYVNRGLHLGGLEVLQPLVRLACLESPREQMKALAVSMGAPLLAFLLFLAAWSALARQVQTGFGTVPSPAEVWTAAADLLADHRRSREAARRHSREQEVLARSLEEEAAAIRKALPTSAPAPDLELQAAELETRAVKARSRRYSAAPTYIDQILTSLKTVFAGFIIAAAVAIPLGVICGLDRTVRSALNPLIQLFRPVSPLAWLPIVMIAVGALYTTDPAAAWFQKSFISSAITVALCSLWPALINTALGVGSVDRDYLNVARVLQLGWWTKVRKIVIPSALPLIFAGLRLSLGVGWMVLIAAEMLAQNPGLGKFVWDMFQNGSSQTLAQIMVAVFTIGFIGFLLDRVMVVLERAVSFGPMPA
jgi:nitrate/nitrite transport system permease protein